MSQIVWATIMSFGPVTLNFLLALISCTGCHFWLLLVFDQFPFLKHVEFSINYQTKN